MHWKRAVLFPKVCALLPLEFFALMLYNLDKGRSIEATHYCEIT